MSKKKILIGVILVSGLGTLIYFTYPRISPWVIQVGRVIKNNWKPPVNEN